MTMTLRLLLLALLTAAAPLAQAPPGGWPAPGDGFDWQPLGDRPIKAQSLAFDDLGRLWVAAATVGHARLDGNIWTIYDPYRSGRTILPLGAADTVLVGSNRIRLTRDGGETWDNLEVTGSVTVKGGDRLIALPAAAAPGPGGLGPGDLLAAQDNGLWRSADRGDTWAQVPYLDGPPDYFARVLDMLALPPGHARAGHLVAALIGGGYVSDTDSGGGLGLRRGTGHEPGMVLEHLALLPSGRVLATGYRVGSGGGNRAFYSDDGGESWTESATRLAEPQDGIPSSARLEVIGPGTAVAVGGRGIVYRTDDAGETWQITGRVPITADNMTSRDLLIDGEGRLVVAVYRAGAAYDDAWVYRTALPLTVAGAAAPAGAALGLSASPNPSSDSAVVRFALASPSKVRLAVFDMLGREVAVLADGERGAGSHAVALDTVRLAPGVYVVRLSAGDAAATTRITVAR